MRSIISGTIFFLFLLNLSCSPGPISTGGTINLIDSIDLRNVVVYYSGFDQGGNTSVDNDTNTVLKWSNGTEDPSDWGYFIETGEEIPYYKRNRDLGQTFLYNEPVIKKLTSIVIRLGYGSNVIRSEMYGQNISLQIFEISGTPVLNDNGTDSTRKAYHGFPHDRINSEIPNERDDYLTGENYKTLTVVRGYVFPQKTDFGFSSNEMYIPPDTFAIKGKFLEFDIPENVNIALQPGNYYAFLIMIDSLGSNRGFTLANNYSGRYNEGHGIRREGKGIFPPVPAVSANQGINLNSDALESARFPENFEDRIKIPPGTNGYPDVDTWRDLVFYIRAE